MSKIEARLKDLAITLPPAAAPVANYVPFVMEGGFLYIAGQVSRAADGGITGKLGAQVSLEQGQAAARVCALNLIAQMQAALGDLDRVKRIVKLGAFVNCTPDFAAIPQVANGCSDLMVEVFGDAGRHARSAVGSVNLPLDFAVEVDAVVAYT